jgi:hypothetical protein
MYNIPSNAFIDLLDILIEDFNHGDGKLSVFFDEIPSNGDEAWREIRDIF